MVSSEQLIDSVLLQAPGKVGFGQVPKPKPGHGQVLIKVDSAALNPSDVLFMQGASGRVPSENYTPGWEGSGVVEEVGSGLATQWLQGKRVAFMKATEPAGQYNIGGAFAEYAITNVKQVIPLDDSASLESGATYFVNPLTAVGMVKRAKELGATALILTAGASQLGRMIVRIAPTYGITPIPTVRRAEQADLLKNEFGCEYVINTSDEDYKTKFAEISKKLNPTVCLECISGETTGEMFNYLGMGGTVILYGALSLKPASGINPMAFLGKNMKMEAFLLPFLLNPMSLLEYAQFVMEVEPLYKSMLTTTISARYGLHEMNEAMAFYAANQTAGKILIRPDLTKKE